MNQYEYLSFFNACKVDENLWVNNIVTNDLYCLDATTYRVLKIIDLELEKNIENVTVQYFYIIASYEDSLFLFPSECHGKMIVYNRKEDTIDYYDLGLEDIDKTCKMALQPAVRDEVVWLFPVDLRVPLLKYDLKYRKLVKVPAWNREISKKGIPYRDELFEIYCHDNQVYIPVTGTNSIIVTDLTSNKTEVLYHPFTDKELYSIAVDNDNIWMTMYRDEALYCWNRKDPSQTSLYKLDVSSRNEEDKLHYFSKIISLENEIIVLPYFKKDYNRIHILDKQSGKVMNLGDKNHLLMVRGLEDFRQVYDCYHGYDILDREVVLYPCGCNSIIKIYLEEERLEEVYIDSVECKLPEYWCKKYCILEAPKNEKNYFIEETKLETKLIIELTKQNQRFQKNKQNQSNSIGKNIWNMLKCHL